ncbi:MAG: LysM peptidoglycan-binding domain-containing protein [Actinomycetota bacterium]|nr:LysM peptidoglycan-binding domain-containing protein [Actinomycetota bacterium]
MQRHPSGKGQRPCTGTHRVRRGETLWGIADAVTDAPDASAVLAATREIYATNRETVGDDPNLILPGQILALPSDCDR